MATAKDVADVLTEHYGGTSPLFPLGMIEISPRAQAACDAVGEDLFRFLFQHCTGKWGYVNKTVRQDNEAACTTGGGVNSRYILIDKTVLWICTNPDRTATGVMLPSDTKRTTNDKVF